jgi:hypothetical protein
MDRFYHRFPALLRWNCERTSHRRWLLLHNDDLRCISHRIRDIHGISLYYLLAISSGSRNLHRVGQWMHAYSYHDNYLNVFPEKATDCYGYRSMRKCHRRTHLPQHGEDVIANDWLWMDVKGHWVHPAWHIDYRSFSCPTENGP